MTHILTYFKNNRAKFVTLLILAICFIGILLFVKNDYSLYKDTIIKVINVQEEKNASESEDVVPSYNQTITAKIMNGKDKGDLVKFENEREFSGIGVYNYDVSIGDELFVALSDTGVGNIIDFKRDFIVVLELLIFCFILVFIASKKSILIFISAIINILIFLLIVFLRAKNIDVFMLFSFAVILFVGTTLLITSGFNKKSFSALISTLISVLLMMIIALIVFKIFSKDIHYEFIEFSEFMYDYDKIFYSGVLISGLGAIMDIAILMSAAVNELIKKDPKIRTKELKKSAWAIAEDTMGTTMNVLFFSCIAGTIPLVIYLVLNKMSIPYAFQNYGFAEIIRALVGSIGIAIAIPISYLTNMIMRKRWHL